MSNCEQYWELISAGVDGALTELERARLQAHLEQCPECRALYEQMQSICGGLGEIEAAPAGFAAGVMAEVAGTEQLMPFTALDGGRDIHAAGKTLLREWWRPIRRIAGLVACCLIVVGVWRISSWTLGGSSAANGAAAPGAAEDMMAAGQDSAMEGVLDMDRPANSTAAEDAYSTAGEPEAPKLTVEGEDFFYTGAASDILPEGYHLAGELPDGREYYAGEDGIYVAEEEGFTFWSRE